LPIHLYSLLHFGGQGSFLWLLQGWSWHAYIMHLPRHRHHTWSNIDSHLKETINHKTQVMIQQCSYMRSSAVVCRWNLALSSFGTDESTSFPLANSILPIWRIAATTLKMASWEQDDRTKQRGGEQSFYTLARKKLHSLFLKKYLIFLTYSNNIHSSPSGKIFTSITYVSQFIAFWLVKVVKRSRIS